MGSRKRRKELKYKIIPLEKVYRTLSSLGAPEQDLLKVTECTDKLKQSLDRMKIVDYSDKLKKQTLMTWEDFNSLFSKLREISQKYQIAIITHQWKRNGNQIFQLKNT